MCDDKNWEGHERVAVVEDNHRVLQKLSPPNIHKVFLVTNAVRSNVKTIKVIPFILFFQKSTDV